MQKSRILVVSDDNVLIGVYSTNLQVYTNAEVVPCLDHEVALDHLEKGERFDLILCQGEVAGEHTGLIVYNALFENEVDIPIVVLGKDSEMPDEVQVVADPMNIPGMIKNCASILGITAKDMMDIDVPKMFPFSIKFFYGLTTVPCEVFCKNDESFDLIFSEQSGVWPEIKKYIDSGTSTLYVHADDRLKLINLATATLLKQMQNKKAGANIEDKLNMVEQGIETVAQSFFTDSKQMTKETVELSKECMETMQAVVEEIPSIKNLLVLLTQNKSGFLYSHSIIASFIADHIVSNISWGAESHKEKLKFVFFFHDIHLAPLYAKYPDLAYEDQLILDKRLTEEEKEMVLNHAEQASEIIKGYPRCPMGADVIIRQHHGTTNGLGFAVNFKDDISPLAKVMIIAEAFTEIMLRSIKEEGKKFEKQEVINQLYEKFTRHTYVKIIDTLATLPM